MEKISLPLSNAPPYCTYHEQAFPLGIMKAHGINVKDWICNETLVLRSPRWDLVQAQCVDKLSFVDYGPIISEAFFIFPKELCDTPMKVINRIIELLADGYYISGYANFRAITSDGGLGPNEKEFIFNIQIYGVDFLKREFLCIGYNRWIYKPYTVTWDQFIESQKKRSDERLVFSKLKFNNNYHFSFDSDNAKRFIIDYLCSRYDYSYNNDYKNYKYGVEAQYRYIDYLKIVKDNNYQIDARNSRSIMEFKNIVYYYLCRYHVLGSGTTLPLLINKIYSGYEQHHLSCVKCILKDNYKELDRIIANFERTTVKENDLLAQIIV